MKLLFTFFFLVAVGIKISSAATFSSVSSGTWSAPATWNVTGGDADGIPDSDDDVTINTGHTVTLINLQNAFKTLDIQSGSTLNLNGKGLDSYGDFTVNGTLTGNFYYFRVYAPTVLSSSSTLTNSGVWYIYSDLTIAAGTAITRPGTISIYGAGTVNNLGNLNVTSGYIYVSGTSNWINGVNSSLTVTSNFSGSNLDFTASGNTLTLSSPCNTLPTLNYYNLTLSGPSTKAASGNITVQNNLTWNTNSSNILNLNNFNLNVGGNWTNSANTNVTNQGTITFDGSGTQTINRTTGIENINRLTVGGTGTVALNCALNVSLAFTINSGTFDLIVITADALRIQNSFTNNGNLNCREQNVLFNGSAAQTINGSSNTQFYKLSLNNTAGLTVNTPQSITNVLSITNGNFNANGNITLVSNSSSTARIATKQSAGCSISGNMTIQKYISARAATWHDLSSPVQSTTINDWDDELYMSGIGTFDGIAGRPGVDGNSSGPSVYSWDETTGNTAPDYGWAAVSGSGTSLVNGSAYEIFIGDDPDDFTGGTIDTRGVPQFGDKTVSLSYTSSQGVYAGTNLVGNPFASAVNYGSCTKTNVTGNVLILDNSGNYTDYGASPVIPPHQGFWIYASSTGASIKFNETAKSTTSVTTFYRTAPNYGIKLVFSSPSSPFFNENTIKFEPSASQEFDQDLDALYLKSPNKIAPAIYMLTNSDARLVTNTINSDKDEVTIPLAIFTPKEATYYIEPTILNTDNYNFVWIENTKTGKKYDLNSAISILGENNKTNYDYVLRLSKTSKESQISQTVFDNDIIIFTTENEINLKSVNTAHIITELSVYDISGKLMFKQNNLTVDSGQSTKIDISNLSKGVYIVNAIDILGHQKTQKVIH